MNETVSDLVGELHHLGATADERTIKRAYAKALKVIRPDEDPVGFQQLHETYQRALLHCQHRANGDGGDDRHDVPAAILVTEPVAPPRVQTVGLAVPAQSDPGVVLAAMLKEGGSVAPAQFTPWLRQLSQDWSFDTRDAVAVRLLQALRDDDVLMCESNVVAMYNLLGWNDIASGVDVRELQWLAERTHRAWLQVPAQHDVLAILMAGPGPNRPSPRQVAWRLAALQTPRSQLRNLWSALRPDRAKGVLELMAALGCQPGVPLPKGIDPGQATFWAGQAQAWSRLEMHVWLFRAALLGLALVGVGLPVMWLDGYGFMREASPLLIAVLALAVGLVPPALVLGRFGRHALYASQLAPESVRSPRPWLRTATVPLLVGLLLVLVAATWEVFLRWIPLYVFVVWLITWQVVRLAQFRYYVRRKTLPPEQGSGLFFMVVGTALFVPALVAAIVFWAMDLHRARAMRWWNP